MQRFSLDHLTETQFEEYCYDLLEELGFTNMSWRKGTGFSSSPSDRGRDIECQLVREDVDGDTILETWFVECKHYKQGVPPDAIQGALSWATSERPDKLLLIASNFLSNPTKDYLSDYQRNIRPSFKIKCWERPRLEKLSLEKLDLLRKYEIFAHLSDTNAYAYTLFMTYFMDFEAALHTSLQIMGVAMPKQAFQSARKMWRLFTYQVGGVSKQYVKDVEEVIVTRNKLVNGAVLSLTPEEIIGLITPLRQAIRFVQTYCISADILPELKEKYSQWLRPEIISVRIIQKNRTVFLEIATKTKYQGLADEAVIRTDLGFISDGNDKDKFPSERSAQENAECFVNDFDPYSIIMCTELFTEEGCKEVDRLYKPSTTMEN